jgi:predicted nucleic-acid-binding protein
VRIALDTNVLVRYLLRDDQRQADIAEEALDAADRIIVSTIVLCETVWVLRRFYKLGHDLIAKTLRDFLSSYDVDVDRLAAEVGLRRLEQGGDFADGVILLDAERAQADRLVTFDRAFGKAPTASKVPLIVLDR